MIKKYLYFIILWFLFYLGLVSLGQFAISKWYTNSESKEIIIQEEEKYYLPEKTINAKCVQFIIKGIEKRKTFYNSVVENSKNLWLDYKLVLSSILWEQIRISCKWVRGNLKSIVLYWTPTLLRSKNISVWIAWIKLNTAFNIKRDAKMYWYGFNDIITEEKLANDDKLSGKVATYLVKNIITRRQLSWYNISDQPWIVWTLYNMGNDKKKQPNPTPKIWWAIIDIDWMKFTYGEISLGIFNYLNIM
jgi:hypothetical protein